MFDLLGTAGDGMTAMYERRRSRWVNWPRPTDSVVVPGRSGAPSDASLIAAPGYRRGGSPSVESWASSIISGRWVPILGGIGWIIASDNASYLMRHRYSARIAHLLSRRRPRTGRPQRLMPRLRALTRDPRAGSALSYPTFALIPAAHAVVWAAVFVEAGYLVTGYWHNTHIDRTTRVATFVGAAFVLVAASWAVRRRRRDRAPSRSA